jgi:hypothetical protein
MLHFKSMEDLNKLDPSDTAYPIIKELLENLIGAYTEAGETYNWRDYGWIILIDQKEELDGPLTEIDWSEDRLATVPWEAITLEGEHHVAVVICNDDAGMVFVWRSDWVSGELADVVRENLDPPIEQQETSSLS